MGPQSGKQQQQQRQDDGHGMTAAFIAGSALVSCVMAVNAELAGAPDASASLFGAPFRSGSPGGSNPAGAAHRDVRRFRTGQDAPHENSRQDCAPATQWRADRRGCAFFGYFLCTSKESNAPAASGAICPRQRAWPQGHQTKVIADVVPIRSKRRRRTSLPLTPTPLPMGEGLEPVRVRR